MGGDKIWNNWPKFGQTMHKGRFLKRKLADWMGQALIGAGSAQAYRRKMSSCQTIDGNFESQSLGEKTARLKKQPIDFEVTSLLTENVRSNDV